MFAALVGKVSQALVFAGVTSTTAIGIRFTTVCSIVTEAWRALLPANRAITTVTSLAFVVAQSAIFIRIIRIPAIT
jgi:hypothetical protein